MQNKHFITQGLFVSLSALIGIGGLPDQVAAMEAPQTPPAIVYQLDETGQVSAAIYDKTGRQVRTLLTGEKLSAGRHTLNWDGLDREGKPMLPGQYEWRVLRTPGFTRHFLVNVGTNPTWSKFDMWPGNHSGPTTVMIDQEGALYVGAAYSEGPPHLLKLSLDGRRKYWDTGTSGVGDAIFQVGRIEDTLYLLDIFANLWIIRADTGAQFWGHPKRRKFPEKQLAFADLLYAGDVRSKPGVIPPMCMAAGKDYLVVTYEKHDEVRFLWPGIDSIVNTRRFHVPAPKGVAVAPDGRVFIVSGREVVLLNPDDGTIKEIVRDPEQQHPTRLAYDPLNNDLLVVQQGSKVSHVRRYSAQDGMLIAAYGKPAGRTYGLFDPLDWDKILDIAADGHGGFITVEEFPRRVARFSGREKHKLVNQWFGGMQWGALCALDPADPTIVYLFPDYKHCARGKIDYAAHTWSLTHLYDLPDNFSWKLGGAESYRQMFPQFGGDSYWSVRHVGGKTFLVNNGRSSGGEGVSVVEVDEKEQKLVPVARLGILHPNIDRLKLQPWWVAAMRRLGFDPLGRGSKAMPSGFDYFCFAWSDTNHNGKIDLDEIHLTRPYYVYTGAHYQVDKEWTVNRIIRAPGRQTNARVGTSDHLATWQASLAIPNKGKDPLYPVWSWDNAYQSKAKLSQGELAGVTPRPVGIFQDAKGNMYETCIGEVSGTAPDTPPTTWPNSTTGACRLVKWNQAGAREWTVGVHTDSKKPPPGAFADIRGILGEIRECLVVLDACTPATVWTSDGLYAGSFLDGRAGDDLPDAAYQRLMRDDHHWGQVLETLIGDVIWGAMSDQSTLFYRIQGWKNWERHSGLVSIKETPLAARAKGSGLRGEYFANSDLTGRPILTRLDQDLWFGPLWGDHYELKARRSWFNGGELRTIDVGAFSARWSGFLELPLAEEFTFVAYVYGRRSSPDTSMGSKVRLWIDGKRVIDEWDRVKLQLVAPRQTRQCQSMPIPLRAGQLVPITLEYAAAGADKAHLHLYWTSPSLDLRHIPQVYLYPELHP